MPNPKVLTTPSEGKIEFVNDDGTEATLEQFFHLHTKYALNEDELNNFTILDLLLHLSFFNFIHD